MTIIPAYRGNNVVPSDNATVGYADYNDVATTGTPLSVTGGGAAVVLENDAAGTFTSETELPNGISSLWNEVTDNFDWSELRIGDTVDIRMDIDVITASVNTTIHIDMHLGTGGSVYTIPFVSGLDFKTIATHHITRYNGLYIGDVNTRDNGGQLKISADKTCTVTVNGWYVRVLKMGA